MTDFKKPKEFWIKKSAIQRSDLIMDSDPDLPEHDTEEFFKVREVLPKEVYLDVADQMQKLIFQRSEAFDEAAEWKAVAQELADTLEVIHMGHELIASVEAEKALERFKRFIQMR